MSVLPRTALTGDAHGSNEVCQKEIPNDPPATSATRQGVALFLHLSLGNNLLFIIIIVILLRPAPGDRELILPLYLSLVDKLLLFLLNLHYILAN